MKFINLLPSALAVGSVLSASLATSQTSSILAPKGFAPVDVQTPADATPSTVNKVAAVQAATATQYWVCLTLSTSTLQYGWSQGGSEASALANAKKKCGKTDCTHYQCAKSGCVGLDYGNRAAWTSYAYGYGTNDGPKAASAALGACKKYDTGCGQPGYFCAKYVVWWVFFFDIMVSSLTVGLKIYGPIGSQSGK